MHLWTRWDAKGQSPSFLHILITFIICPVVSHYYYSLLIFVIIPEPPQRFPHESFSSLSLSLALPLFSYPSPSHSLCSSLHTHTVDVPTPNRFGAPSILSMVLLAITHAESVLFCRRYSDTPSGAPVLPCRQKLSSWEKIKFDKQRNREKHIQTKNTL